MPTEVQLISDGAVTGADISNSTITADDIANNAVTTAKIADNAVTADKLRDDATTDANRAVTTNHIRNNAVTTTKISFETALVPLGGIIMWSGSIVSIPTGWALCNGSNGTPNLRNRFIVGAGSGYAVGETGGSADATLVSHSHTASTNTAGSHYHQLRDGDGGNETNSITADGGNLSGQNRATDLRNLPSIMSTEGLHGHTVTVDATGSSATNANLPPYYALAFIMRVS